MKFVYFGWSITTWKLWTSPIGANGGQALLIIPNSLAQSILLIWAGRSIINFQKKALSNFQEAASKALSGDHQLQKYLSTTPFCEHKQLKTIYREMQVLLNTCMN